MTPTRIPTDSHAFSAPVTYRFIDPISGETEYETASYTEAEDYVQDLFTEDPLLLEIWQAGELVNSALYHADHGKLN